MSLPNSSKHPREEELIDSRLRSVNGVAIKLEEVQGCRWRDIQSGVLVSFRFHNKWTPVSHRSAASRPAPSIPTFLSAVVNETHIINYFVLLRIQLTLPGKSTNPPDPFLRNHAQAHEC